MNKLMLATAFAAVCAFAAFSAPVFAQPASGSSTSEPATVVTKAPATAKTTAKSATKRAVPAVASRTCIRDTGTHIKRSKGECVPVAGSSYSQKDLQRTGAATTAEALRMLDPSVQIGGH